MEDSGLKKITVIDNGCGMEKEDLDKCYQPFTTSKLSDEMDLIGIRSLGFRGEALVSMASVSDVIIKSREQGAKFGHIVELSQNERLSLDPVGMPEGTEVTINSLFTYTPARRHFIKNKAGELRKIINIIIEESLTKPEIGFSLEHNDKKVFQFPEGEDIINRLRRVWGEKISSNLISIESNSPYCEIEGFIGKPQIASRTKSRQFIFVNGRPIKDSTLSWAVKDAFGSLLPARAYPVFAIFLKMPAETLDVNIHPRKENVRFLNKKEITDLIKEAILKSLGENNLIYKMGSSLDKKVHNIFEKYGLSRDGEEIDYKKMDYSAQVLRDNTNLWQVNDAPLEEADILQIKNMYLVSETKEGLLVVDQHAAHERILYEQLKESLNKVNESVTKHNLKNPLVFDLPITEAKFLEDNLNTFHDLGFEIEIFGGSSFKISVIPDIFKERDINNLISEVIYDLVKGDKPLTNDLQTDRIVNFLACRSAIKTGGYLNMDERRKLIKKLREIESKYTCPHGRPAQMEIGWDDLETIFKRR